MNRGANTTGRQDLKTLVEKIICIVFTTGYRAAMGNNIDYLISFVENGITKTINHEVRVKMFIQNIYDWSLLDVLIQTQITTIVNNLYFVVSVAAFVKQRAT